MEDLESIITSALKKKEEKERTLIEKWEKERDEKIELANEFLRQIEFLNKYGFDYHVTCRCNNRSDCCYGDYEYIVHIDSRHWPSLYVAKVDGEIKARQLNTICYNYDVRFVKGEDEKGFFTPRQYVEHIARIISR